jgi:hypothetical protein
MNVTQSIEILISLVAGGLFTALAWRVLRMGRCRCTQSCSFLCPRYRSLVSCEMEQDVRTGQWKELQSCSIFRKGEDVPCDWACLRRLNLGVSLQGWTPPDRARHIRVLQ